jgi:adenylate kinase
MVRDRLSESDVDDGCLLDGYPRTTVQVDYLDRILADGSDIPAMDNVAGTLPP